MSDTRHEPTRPRWLSAPGTSPYELTTTDDRFGRPTVTLVVRAIGASVTVSPEIAHEPDGIRWVVEDLTSTVKRNTVQLLGLDGEARDMLSRKLFKAALDSDPRHASAILDFLAKYVPLRGDL